MKKIPLWIDCDTGIDDAFALLVAHGLPALQIVGISTVSGNVHLEISTPNTLKVLQLAGSSTPVYRGAAKPLCRDYHDASEFHGPDGLGGAVLPQSTRPAEEKAMWDALYETAKALGGELTVATIGPVTNLATALQRYPDLPKYLKQVVFMGGSASGGNCTAYAEYNVYADPEALQMVCDSGIPLVMCPLDMTHGAYLTAGDLEELATVNTPVTRFIHESSGVLLGKNLEAGLPGICQHDTCPLMYLAHPELFSGKEASVHVEINDPVTLGKTYVEPDAGEKNALVLLNLDRSGFLAAAKAALLSY